MLFDGSDSDDNEVSFKTENEYAKKYDTWREKEELYKLEQKYGDKVNSSGSESTDSEDESDEPPEVTEQMEKEFLKTLSLLKKKDPRIYDPKYKFYTDTEESDVKKIDAEVETKPKKQVNTLAAAFADSDDDSGNGEIFKVEKKAPQPENKEVALKDFLIGKKEHVEDEAELAPLKALWSDPKISHGEAFLRDYILDKKYLDEDAGEDDEADLDAEALEEDEARVEEQGNFERAYNFRFEEPDQDYLKRYPRTMSTVRPKDDRRSRKRAEIRERKEQEKKKKMEEIARLKSLKLKEIQEKIARIKEVTGNQDLAFKDEDIEGDFDPEEHDRRMQAIFDEEYYGDVDTKKPVFPDLDEELEIENWDNYDEGNQNEALHCEDEDFNMDADYDPKKARSTLMEEIKETLGKKRRNRKKKSKLAEILSTEKPKYVPVDNDKTYSQYMEEYYKMDCEDVIGGDLPTRFKYRDVVPNSFGLTIEEILLADDIDLNKWASLKKTVKYRPVNVEKGEVNTYKIKANDLNLKKKLLPSLFKELPEEAELVVQTEKKKKQKNKDKQLENSIEVKEEHSSTNSNGLEKDERNVIELNQSERKKKKKKDKLTKEEVVEDEINSNNKDEKRKNNRIDEESIEAETVNDVNTLNGFNIKEKKKKKKNKRSESEESAGSKLENSTNEEQNSEEVVTTGVSSGQFVIKTSDTEVNNVKKKNKKNKMDESSNVTSNDVNNENKGNVKRKFNDTNANNGEPAQKKKKQNDGFKKDTKHKKDKTQKNKNSKKKLNKLGSDKNDNPLGKLSDERLKAFGLNPKKYRGFLKYKKY